MDAIKQWAFSICAAMVAAGLAQMLLPKSGMEKIFRTTVSIFFLCCLLSPIVLRDPGLRLELQEYSQSEIDARARRLTKTIDSQTGEAMQWQLEKIISEKLSQMGINYHQITININNNGQSGQEIQSVEIILDRVHEKDHQKIHAELARALGLTVRLGYKSPREG